MKHAAPSSLSLCDPHRPERTLSRPVGHRSAVNRFPSNGPGFYIGSRSRSSPHRSPPTSHRSLPTSHRSSSIPNRTTALLTDSFPSPLGELRSSSSESAVSPIYPRGKYNLFCPLRTNRDASRRCHRSDDAYRCGSVEGFDALRPCSLGVDTGVSRVRPTRLAEAEPEQELAEIPRGRRGSSGGASRTWSHRSNRTA